MSENSKLTAQQQALVDQVLKNLEEGAGLWKQGWVVTGAPQSATTGKRYRGLNNFFLILAAMREGYKDNRWATFHQIQENGWSFKTDEEGKSIAKGKSETVEFYELRDKATKKPFDRSVLEGLTKEERDDYMKENVYPLRKYYKVFNADIIDGIPAPEQTNEIDERTRSERAEQFIDFWSKTESEISYGGGSAYYNPKTDKIRLPERSDFHTAEDYYSTAFHEIGHSTGHEKRLNRNLEGGFGSSEYAKEELRAEIASMFIEQEFGIEVDESAVRNNSAYLQAWKEEIKEDPNALFKAIIDADRIAKYLVEKEKSMNKRVQKYAIRESENAVGDTIYRVYMQDESGAIVMAMAAAYDTREQLMESFKEFQEDPLWKDAEFQEVSYEELSQTKSDAGENEKQEEEAEIIPAPSQEYIRPSELVARSVPAAVAVNMADRGIDSLTRMSDREVVEKAKNVRGGDTFSKLYNGERVFESETKDERILMMRLGMFCNGDTEQLVRVFKSSGQFRDIKPTSYYMQLAERTMTTLNGKFNPLPPKTPVDMGKGKFGMNAKI